MSDVYARRNLHYLSDFDNKFTHNDIRYSRYIASWIRVTEDPLICKGDISDSHNQLFIEWLRSENLTEKEIDDIRFIAGCGKCELEKSIRNFLEDSNHYTEAL